METKKELNQQTEAPEKGDKIDNQKRYQSVLDFWMKYWVIQGAANWQEFRSLYNQSRAGCLSMYKGKFEGPVIVTGSGVTLNEVAPLIKDCPWPVIASCSHAKTLARWGKIPEYMVAYDSNPAPGTLFDKMKGYNWKKTTLLAHPSIDPKIVNDWKGNLLLHHSILNTPFHLQYLPMMYPWIRAAFLSTGSSASTAVQIAHYLGYSPVILVGVDMCYLNETTSADMWDWVKLGKGEYEWKKIEPHTIQRLNRKLHTLDDGTLTTEEMIDYKIGLMAIIHKDKIPVVSATQSPMMKEIPYRSLDQLKLNQEFTEDEWKQSHEEIGKYLEAHGVFKQKEEQMRKLSSEEVKTLLKQKAAAHAAMHPEVVVEKVDQAPEQKADT